MKPIAQLSDAEFEHLARQAVALPDAPADCVRSALALFPARTALAGLGMAAAALARQVLAVLSFDSWAPQAVPAGVRSVPSEARHLVFSALGRDIDLRILPAAGQFALAGQILGPDETGTVELVAESADGSLPRSAPLDALGEFRLDGVPGGRYVMTLHLAGEQVLLPPIEVGARRP
jgi:hypothetical protein